MERTLAQSINANYEHAMAGEDPLYNWFDRIGFLNLGYWRGIEDSVELAQINLIETLAGFLNKSDCNVLDVACGTGASTRFLKKYFAPKKITGINIAERQLEICKLIAPDCTFLRMDAANLDFDDSSFDNILCIEAGLHFLTRQKFFEEAYRVLKPAGRLAMLDFLCNYDVAENHFGATLPRENYLPDLDAYRESLLKVGFKYVRVEDCTELTVNAADDFVIRMEERSLGKGRDSSVFANIRRAQIHRRAFSPGCFVYVVK